MAHGDSQVQISNFSSAWVPSLEIRPPVEREAETSAGQTNLAFFFFLQSTGWHSAFPASSGSVRKNKNEERRKKKKKGFENANAPCLSAQGSLQLRVLR